MIIFATIRTYRRGITLHIVDSYLQLTAEPLSIRKFNGIKKMDNELRKQLDQAILYMIVKREVPRIQLSNMVSPNIEKSENIIPLSISLREKGVSVHAVYIFPAGLGHEFYEEMKDLILDSEFEELIYASSQGPGQICFQQVVDVLELFTYEVLYVGQCIDEPLTKRFRAHHALQDMLIEEQVISKDYSNSEN